MIDRKPAFVVCLVTTCFPPHLAHAGPLWTYVAQGDTPLCLAQIGDVSGDGRAELVAGLDSGRVVCLSTGATGEPEVLWSCSLEASVLALLPVPDIDGDGLDGLVLATDTGLLACIQVGRAAAGQRLWTYRSRCNLSTLALLPDVNHDAVPEVVFSGADQQVHVCDARTGSLLWRRRLASERGNAYVMKVACAGDLNADRVPDVAVWAWSGELHALDGTNGHTIWARKVDPGFTDAMAPVGDVDGDGRCDFVVGGNGRTLRLCSGRDGSVRWNAELDRPVRDVVAPPDVAVDEQPYCFGATAGGWAACVPLGGSGDRQPRWTANLGDVGRAIVSPGDLDGDRHPDAVAGAENGEVAAFASSSGQLLWRWRGPDVVRALCCVGDADTDGVGDVAAATLDGTIVLLSGRSGGGADASPRTTKPVASALADRTAPPIASKPRSRPAASAVEVPILLYHDVLPEAIYRYSTSVEDFRRQMHVLARGGFNCVSLDEIADWVEGRGALPSKPVCITFDGPYDGHHTYAVPILKDRGLFAVSYITSDWIGTANHADWHQLREAERLGVLDIQNHSLNHPALPGLDRDSVVEQLQGCNGSIARHLYGKTARHHAYPAGAENTAVRQITRSLGFRTATTTVAKHVSRTSDLMALPRYTVKIDTTLDEFKSWIRYDADMGDLPEPPDAASRRASAPGH